MVHLTDVTGKFLQEVIRKIRANHNILLWRFVNANGETIDCRPCTGTETSNLATFGQYGFVDIPYMNKCTTYLDASIGGIIFNLVQYKKGEIPMLNYHNCLVETL